MQHQLLDLREKLRSDFPFFSENTLKIRTKDGELKPFVLNRAQRRLWALIQRQKTTTGMVRIIILKGRQMGLSTAVAGYFYQAVTQLQAQKASVVTHHADSTRALFDMTLRYHTHTPSQLRQPTSYSSRRELVFERLDSSYVVGTAGGSGVGRGETINHLHVSELAFWGAGAKETFNGLYQSVPHMPGSSVIIESTAQGMSGAFAEMWRGAVAGENGFEPIFLPWYIEPQYRDVVPPGWKRSFVEQELVDKHGLDDGQLAFRRRQVYLGSVQAFQQEYPATVHEAFVSKSRCVFNPDQLVEILKGLPPEIGKLAWMGDQWIQHPGGELLVWEGYDNSKSYYIGCDVALGLAHGDFSVAQVLDGAGNQVARWRGHIEPDLFADVIDALGRSYGAARVVVELNGPGLLTAHRLHEDLNYPDLWVDKTVDRITNKETTKLGFTTSLKSKGMIVNELRAAIRDEEVILNDRTTVLELQTFVVTESGKLEGDDKCFDDCVIALALATHINEGDWTPIQNQESWYLDVA